MHVPNLTCNPILVSKLTCIVDRVAKFSSISCSIQELKSGRMISTAREDSGLYYFVGDEYVDKQATIVEGDSIFVFNNCNKVIAP